MTTRSILKRIVPVTVSLLLGIFVCLTVFAQSSTSHIKGTVTDSQGNVVPGATVTVKDPTKNFSRSQTTNDSGSFSFNLIPPGTYQVSVEAKGFKKSLLTGVNALLDKPTDLQVALEVGSVSETVTVSSGVGEVLLNTQDAPIGNNFVNQQI